MSDEADEKGLDLLYAHFGGKEHRFGQRFV